MNIKILLNNKDSHEFPVDLLSLEKALQTSSLGIGTCYAPIEIDDFINVKNTFPEIKEHTNITLTLEQLIDEKDMRIKLICVKLVNVGIEFNELPGVNNAHWHTIFECPESSMISPDGTLYLQPDDLDKCSITTKKVASSFLRYSILFSAELQKRDNTRKEYFFLIDPLIKVSSSVGNSI